MVRLYAIPLILLRTYFNPIETILFERRYLPVKKRIFAALVCAVLCCGMFAGCAKSEEQQLQDELNQLKNELGL